MITPFFLLNIAAMKKILILLFVIFTYQTKAQPGIIAKEKFSKISVSESITKQVITQSKESYWVFTEESIYCPIGLTNDGMISPLTVLKYKYDLENFFVFLCIDPKNQTEYAIQYKNTEPKRVSVSKMDGTAAFHCHN